MTPDQGRANNIHPRRAHIQAREAYIQAREAYIQAREAYIQAPEGSISAREAYIEAVLSLVEQIPSGRVMTYGAIADHIGRGGPRQVGRVLALHGGGVAWWRVVRSDGSLPDSHRGEAVARYHEEATPLRGTIAHADTLRVDVGAALWSPTRST